MTLRKRAESRKAKRLGRKSKVVRPGKTAKAKKKAETPRLSSVESSAGVRQFENTPPQARERYVITVEDIRGDTAIGDLLVTFPRTRDVLARKGLRLESEEAGDIYMTLDVFSAMNGVEIQSLVREIVEIAKEPMTQQLAPQVAAPPVP